MYKGTIERAFELAPECVDIEQVRETLKSEGYSSVDAHLLGQRIRSDLKKIMGQSVQPD